MPLDFLFETLAPEFSDRSVLDFDVTALSDGTFVVLLEVQPSDLFGIPELFPTSLFLLRIDQTGQIQDSLVDLSDAFGVTQGLQSPAVAALPDGGFVVSAVLDADLNDDNAAAVLYQVFGAAGDPVGEPVRLEGLADLSAPAISVFADGSFAVSAIDLVITGDGSDATLQIFSSGAGAVSATAPGLSLSGSARDTFALSVTDTGEITVVRPGIQFDTWTADEGFLPSIAVVFFDDLDVRTFDFLALGTDGADARVLLIETTDRVLRLFQVDESGAPVSDPLILDFGGPVSGFELRDGPSGLELLYVRGPVAADPDSLLDLASELRIARFDQDLSSIIVDTLIGTVPVVTQSPLEGLAFLSFGPSLLFSAENDGPAFALLQPQGTSADDTLEGTGLDERLVGGNGDDLLSGGAGSDRLLGGEGDDTLIAGGGGAFDPLAADSLFGGAGDDLLRLDRDLVDGSVRSAGRDGQQAFAGTGDDTIEGSDGADRLGAGPGSDIIRGNRGDDLLFGGRGGASCADTLHGGLGDDTLFAADGDDALFGGGGDDLVFANDGADSLVGGSGADTLFGGRGADTVLADAAMMPFSVGRAEIP